MILLKCLLLTIKKRKKLEYDHKSQEAHGMYFDSSASVPSGVLDHGVGLHHPLVFQIVGTDPGMSLLSDPSTWICLVKQEFSKCFEHTANRAGGL